MTEMRRLADLSGRKADAMLARRGRREKRRVLRAWRCLHHKRKQRRARAERGAGEGGRTKTSRSRVDGGRSNSSSSGSDEVSGSGSSAGSGSFSSSSGSERSSRSAGGSSDGDRSSSFASSLSTKEHADPDRRADDASSLSSSAAPPRSFPVPSAAEAAEAGRANFSACFQAQTEREKMAQRRREKEAVVAGRKVAASMAPVEVAAEAARRAIRCGGGRKGARDTSLGFTTPEMRALARFEWHRKTHEAAITRVVYGS